MAADARASGLTDGAIQNMSYDSVGRPQWITRPDGFWKYIAYADRGDAVMSQVSIAEYPTSAWSITVVMARINPLSWQRLPNSYGGYAGAFTYYDNMGRVSQQSNVEERMLIGRRSATISPDGSGLRKPMIGRVATGDQHVTDGTTNMPSTTAVVARAAKLLPDG